MNDLLKKLMAGIPQQEDFQPMEQNDPYLAPNIFPSPLMTPLQSGNNRLRIPAFEPEEIQANIPKPANIKPSLPFTKPAENIEIPDDVPEKKTPTLEEILAGINGPTDNSDLTDTQNKSNDYIKAVLMARAADQVGSSIAGVKPKENFGEDLIGYANKQVTDLKDRKKADGESEDQFMKRKNQAISEVKSGYDVTRAAFELGDKEKENDPNSDVSKGFRELAKEYVKMSGANFNIDERLSYSDLQRQMGVIGNILTNKMAQDARKDNMVIAKAAKEESAQEKAHIKRLDFAAQQHDKIIKSDPYKKLSVAEEQYKSALEALRDPSGVKDIDILYRTVRGFDPNSAVREGEITLAKEAISIQARAKIMMSTLGENPRVLPASFIREVLKLAEMNRLIANKQYKRHLAGILKNAKKRGFEDEDMDLIDPTRSSNFDKEIIVDTEDPRIEAFMKKNNIKDKNEAIKILKDAGKL